MSIPLTANIAAALESVMRGLRGQGEEGSYTLRVELPKIDLADAVLSALGLTDLPPVPEPTDPPLDPRRRAIPFLVRLRVFARDGFRCRCCGTGEDLTIDHVIPWSLGGSDDEQNLQTLCSPCNSRKGTRVQSV